MYASFDREKIEGMEVWGGRKEEKSENKSCLVGVNEEK